MDVELIIAPEAQQDLDESYEWYERQRPGLGEDFLGCVDACIDGIHRSPKLWAITYKTYRRAIVRRFPYAVFYEFEDDVVTVYCVFHCSQDPDKWKRRLS